MMRVALRSWVGVGGITLSLCACGGKTVEGSGQGTGGGQGATTTGAGGTQSGAEGSSSSAGGGSSVGGAMGATCSSRSDCSLYSDCCTCRALPRSAGVHACDVLCNQDACSAAGISEDDVACVAGRCVLNRSCDDSNVTCEVATPTCERWSAPEVVDDCYTGRCLPVDECSRVASCKVCEGAELACAVYVTQLGLQYHCVFAPAGCDVDDCECMGVCSDGFTCGPGLSCNCLGC